MNNKYHSSSETWEDVQKRQGREMNQILSLCRTLASNIESIKIPCILEWRQDGMAVPVHHPDYRGLKEDGKTLKEKIRQCEHLLDTIPASQGGGPAGYKTIEEMRTLFYYSEFVRNIYENCRKENERGRR